MSTQTFEAKSIIFREGEPTGSAYILESGKVEILKSSEYGDVSVATIAPGNVFGEMSLLEDRPKRSATARALESSTVTVIEKPEFEHLMNSCPPNLLPIIRTLVGRIKPVREKRSRKDPAMPHVQCEYTKLTVHPGPGRLEGEFEPMEMTIDKLPLRVGGYPEGGERDPYSQNHLWLPCEGPPLVVSANHFLIELTDEGHLELTDRGSRFTTVVNGFAIGQGRGTYRALLKPGENEIVLGGRQSEYRLRIVCE